MATNLPGLPPIKGQTASGQQIDTTSPEVVAYMKQYPAVSPEAAIGSVIQQLNARAAGAQQPATPSTAGSPGFGGGLSAGQKPPASPAPQAPAASPASAGGDVNNPQYGSQSAFMSAYTQIMGKAQQNQALQDQKNLLIKQLYDQPLTPEELRTLSPAQQQAIQAADKGMLEYQILSLNDVIKGRTDAVKSSLDYMLQGYQADQAAAKQAQAEADKKRDDAWNMIKDMTSKYSSDQLQAAGITQDEMNSLLTTGAPTPEMVMKLFKLQSLAAQKLEASSDKPLTMTDALKLAAGASDPAAAWSFLKDQIGKTAPSGSAPAPGSGTPYNVGGYDISSYATDPSHESSIQNIITNMGQMKSTQQMDNYIKSVAKGSPITGEMIAKASEKYKVSWEMIMAMMQQDSSFGTAGKAVSTKNPGNVGNTDSGATKTFGSWQEGVDAVASWLSKHKATDAGAVQSATGAAALQKASAGNKITDEEVKLIADGVINGSQPPDLSRLYGASAKVKAELEKRGYNLTKATLDWQAMIKYVGNMNGAAQIRLRQAVDFVDESLGILEGLNQEWQRGGFGPLNAAQLKVAASGAMGQDAQEKATKFENQLNDMIAELGTVYKGGNTSTDESLKQAAKMLSTDWSAKTLQSNIDLIKQNIQLRKNSIANTGIVTVGGQIDTGNNAGDEEFDSADAQVKYGY